MDTIDDKEYKESYPLMKQLKENLDVWGKKIKSN